MSLNTYPYNPFPASTDKLDEAHNAELQKEVDQLKEDTGELREDVEKLETDKTDTAVIAPEFDAEAGVYSVGDVVMYQGKLYEFTTAHETAGDWDPTEVTEKTVADEIGDVKSGLTNLVRSETVTLSDGIQPGGGPTISISNVASTPKIVQIVEPAGGKPLVASNWWVSSGTLFMQIINLSTAAYPGGDIVVNFLG